MAFGAGCILIAQTAVQSSPSESPALAGTSTNGQTEIRSDNGGEFHYKLKTYIYRGNVHVDDPKMNLRCELLTVESPELLNGNKFNRATAETNVVIDWLDENGTNHATAAKAVYTYILTNLATLPEQRWQTSAVVVLSGNPYVIDGRSNVFTGDPINWDRINGVISTPNVLDMKFKPNQTNSPGMFDTKLPGDKPAVNKPAPK
jgi:lipopolysaccharide export system protein LptA